MLKKSKIVIAGLLAAAGLAAASSAMAYQQWNSTTTYGPNAIVESQNRVFLHKPTGYDRGDVPRVGGSFAWGNTWEDKGALGTVVSIKPPVTSTPSAPVWSSGSGYAQGAMVSYNGVRYQARVAISASDFFSRIAPSTATTQWARV